MRLLAALGSSCVSLGLLAVALGAYWLGSDVSMGTMRNIGPGFLPRVLSIAIMAGACVQIAIDLRQHYRSSNGFDFGPIPVRAIALISVGVIAFAGSIGTAGLLIASFLSSFFTGVAVRPVSLLKSFIISVLLSVSVVLVFAYALGLHIKVFP